MRERGIERAGALANPKHADHQRREKLRLGKCIGQPAAGTHRTGALRNRLRQRAVAGETFAQRQRVKQRNARFI